MSGLAKRAFLLATLVVAGGSIGPVPSTAFTKAGVELASSDRMGSPLGTDSFLPPSLNRNGRYVIFRSQTDGFVPGDSDGEWDVYRKDLATGKLEWISVGVSGAASHGDMSADGRFVAFYADRTYLRDVDRGTTTVVDGGTPLPVDAPAVSDDGMIVAFVNSTGLLVANRAEGTVVEVGEGSMLDLTADGRRVVFVEREDSTARLIRVDLLTRERTALFEGPGGSGNGPVLPFVSADASVVTFTLFREGYSRVDAMVWEDGVVTGLTGVALSAAGQVSDDGKHVVLFTATALTAEVGDVVLLNRLNDGTTKVGTTACCAWSMSLSRDGRAVAWTTREGVVPDDDNGADDVYVSRLPGR